jgi:hypothetical protein
MAANKGKETIEVLFNEVLTEIAENGKSLISALKGRLSSQTFYDYLDKNDEWSKKYARATELRAEKMAEETLEIADCIGDDVVTLPDGREVENQRVINRDRLRVDTRKWLLSKLHPKKYGEKISQELTGKDGAALIPQTIIVKDQETKTDLEKLG